MKPLVLFDFDGVIADTTEFSYGIGQKMGFLLSLEAYRDMFMGNVYDAIDAQIPAANRSAHYKTWFEHYGADLLNQVVTPGIPEAINTLAKTHTLVVVTSSIDAPIHSYLEFHNLHHFFDTVLGADVHASKVEKIQLIFEKYTATARDCIFVTDTVGDLLEAKKKNVPTIAVTWGLHPKERFADTPPLAFAQTPEELITYITNHFKPSSL